LCSLQVNPDFMALQNHTMDEIKRLNIQKNRAFLANEAGELEELLRLLEDGCSPVFHNEAAGWRNLIFSVGIEPVRYHRVNNPFAEFTEKINENDLPEILVCLGTGFGYQLINAGRAFSAVREVILIEPLVDPLFTLLSEIELSSVLPANVRILYAPKPDIVIALLKDRLNRYRNTRLNIVALDSAPILYPGYIDAILTQLGDMAILHQIYLLSSKHQFEEITGNVLANVGALRESSTLCPNGASGERALVVSSGPSLDRVLPLMPALKEKVHIIVAGSALHTLRCAGIEPDLAVIGDPQRLNEYHFSDEEYPCDIAYDPVIPAAIIDKFKGQRIAFTSGHPINEIFAEIAGLQRISCWGTISSAAIDIARVAGFSELAIAGMDFSFAGKRSHAQYYLLKPRDEKDVRVNDRRGRKVSSTPTLLRYAQYVENQISLLQSARIRIVNLMEGGVLKNGEPLLAREYLAALNSDRKKKRSWRKSQPLTSPADLPDRIVEKLEHDRESLLLMLRSSNGVAPNLNQVFAHPLGKALEGAVLDEAKAVEDAQLEGDDENLNSAISRLCEGIDMQLARIRNGVKRPDFS
jgi:hypothetical protein